MDKRDARAVSEGVAKGFSGVALWPRLVLDPDGDLVVESRGPRGQVSTHVLSLSKGYLYSRASRAWRICPCVAETAYRVTSTSQLQSSSTPEA